MKKKKVSRHKKNKNVSKSMSLDHGSQNSLPIPIDIIITIFSRLNLKSIAICRCVSKLWASILRRSDFTELFLSKSYSSSPKLLFACIQNDGELLFFSSPQPQNPNENSSPLLVNYQIKFSSGPYMIFIDCVHGLIYLKKYMCVEKKLVVVEKICNPSTGQTLKLPMRKSRDWSFFGYDPIGKKFKVLSMTRSKRDDAVCEEYQVMTLGSEKLSWRTKECCVPLHSPRQHLCFNGVLYCLSIDRLTNTCIIVCFDVRFEKFSYIKTTETFNGAMFGGIIYLNINLINYNGKLGLIYLSNDDFVLIVGSSINLKLWVLEDHERQEWYEHTFVFSTMPKNIVGKVMLKFAGVTKQNEIVYSSKYPFCLFYLNLEKNTIVSIEIQGMDGMDASDSHHVILDHVEDVKLYGSLKYL